MQTTGPLLRLERRTAEVTITAVAARMGRSRQTVHNIERSAVVNFSVAESYLNAVRDIAVERAGAR